MKMKNLSLSAAVIVSVIALSACSTLMGKKAQTQRPEVYNANQPSEQQNATGATQNQAAAATQAYGQTGSSFADTSPKCQLAVAKGGVAQHYFFNFDQSNIRSQYMKSLQVQADYLTTNPKAKVKIAGNTDDRGSREYNIALGWRRAKAIARVLEQYGVEKSQLKLVSYGAEKPVMLGTTDADYQCNRRVDIQYLG